MLRFSYTAIDINKKKYKGEFLASDEKHLRQLLSAQDLFLVSCKIKKNSSQIGGFFSLSGAVKQKDVTLFCKQFSIMITAGIDIVTALDTLKMQPTYPKTLKLILNEMLNDINSGKSLSDAMRIHKKIFPEFFVSMVNVGEESGSLDVVLVKLAEYYENQQATKSKIIGALIYPMVLVCMALGIILVMALFIIPTFQGVFDSIDGELPKITQIIFGASDFMIENILTILAVVGVVVVLFVAYGRTKSGKLLYDKMKAKMPIIGNVVQSKFASRFARSFSILLGNGMQAVESLEILSNLLGNKYYEKLFQQCIIDVKQGVSLTTTFSRSKMFPSILLQMILVGEQSGTLDEILATTSDFFDSQLNESISKATGMIQPILLVVIGVVIAAVLIGIFLPLTSLTSSISDQQAHLVDFIYTLMRLK